MPLKLDSAPSGSWMQTGRPDFRLDVLDTAEEIGADLVHFVDEDDARHSVFVGLTPHGLGLRLDSLVAVEDTDCAVEHAQRTLDLDREIDMAGGVDDVEPLALPEGRCRGRGDRNAALLLLLHPVHGGRAFMDFADLVRFARVIEYPLGCCCLARVDMGHDTEVPVVFDGMAAGHGRSPSGGKNGLSD